MELRKGSVIALVALAILSTTGFAFAAGPAIMNVLVTNWPKNQNVTVTNKPFLWASPIENVSFASQTSRDYTLSAGGYERVKLNFVATFFSDRSQVLNNYSFYEPAISTWFNGTYCSFQGFTYDVYRVDISSVVPGKGPVPVLSQEFTWNSDQECSTTAHTVASQKLFFQVDGISLRSPNVVITVFYQQVRQEITGTIQYSGYSCGGTHRTGCYPILVYQTVPSLTYPSATGNGVFLSLYAVD